MAGVVTISPEANQAESIRCGRLQAAAARVPDKLLDHDYHKERITGNVRNKLTKFKCSVPSCTWPGGAHRSTLFYHNRQFHPKLVGGSIGQSGSVCCKCKAQLLSVELLAEHLKNEHNEPIVIEQETFASAADFEAWKDEVRNSACVDFVTRRQWKTTSKHRANVFYCSRSGKKDQKGTGQRPPRISVKSNIHCCAFLSVKCQNNGTVSVRHCLQHCGHDVNRARLRLINSEKALIAHYLKEGNSTDWVVKKLRALHSSPSDRLYYITAQTVDNIKAEWEIESSRLHAQDMASIAERLRRDADERSELNDCSDFFGYSPAVDAEGTGFCLGVMTKEQRDWLKEFGNKGVCVDATHNSTRYKFLLVTLLVLDDRQKGRPVAHYFCKGESKEDLIPFFEAVKERCGELSPRTFMSDDAPAYFNAWSSVFTSSPRTKKLLCAWHVLKNWRKNLKSFKPSSECYKKTFESLRSLLRQSNKEVFVKHLTALLSELSLLDRNDFREYLETNYLKSDKLATWAPYCRRKEVVNTNMALESFHNVFKSKYLRRSENRRLDFTVHALLKHTTDLSRDSDVMKSVPTCFRQHRLTGTNRNHRKAVDFYGSNKHMVLSTPDPDIFVVQSQSKEQLFYIVKKLSSCACDRLRRCRYDDCYVCWEEFDCDCFDSCRAGVACKHVHAVKMYLFPSDPDSHLMTSDHTSEECEINSAASDSHAESEHIAPPTDDIPQHMPSSQQEKLSAATKNTATYFLSLIDSVPENVQIELNSRVQMLVDFAIKHTATVAPRKRVNGRPQNAPLQDVYKLICLGLERKLTLQYEFPALNALSIDSPGSGDEGNDQNLSKKELQDIERKRQKNKKRKEQKKRRAKEKQTDDAGNTNSNDAGGEQSSGTNVKTDESAVDSGTGETPAATDDEDVEVEFVGQMPKIELQDPNYHYFTKIFQTFKIGSGEDDTLKVLGLPQVKKEEAPTKAAIVERILQEEMEEKREREREEGGDIKKLSKKKLRLSMRPSIAVLKASTLRPDVVEWHDVTSKDPHLLVQLKAYRNSVPVPRHWCAKRKYLAGKRGFERAPFELPDNIKRTGIMEMREALAEKEDSQSLKSKMRERMRPKLGRIDIDYQKLHDAFFKWQTKPPLTKMGDLYFEGKELETQMREKKPGELSDDLRIALGMPVGPNAHKFPPPWLIAMQRYGPPPSYPNLKVAGLNAPIPESCAFGYHAGGWGKPPVDEYGKPLYGDVFGLDVPTQPQLDDEAAIERRHWGEMDSDEEAEESSDEEDDEDANANDQPVDASGMATPMQEGMITPSGISSGIPTGVETPDTIELRKRKQVEEGSEAPGPLYTVLPEKKIDRVGGQMMASTHIYEMAKKDRNVTEGGVEVSLNPEELDMQDQKGLERKYEEQLRKQAKGKEEDFSDMVAEHSAKQNRKRKAQDQKKAPTTKKNYKDFKF